MAVQLSPGVNVSEVDLTTIVPTVSTSVGAIGGIFPWGPVGVRILVDSETKLIRNFNFPTSLNAETFFSAASFLSYTNALYVVRGANTSGNTPTISFSSAANSTVSNNVFIGNTSGLSVGQYVIQSNNLTVVTTGNSVNISAVNSTAITLSQNTTSNSVVNLTFGNPGTAYSAMAVEPGYLVSNVISQTVLNDVDYFNKSNTFDTNVRYIAKYPGAIGNSIRVGVCDAANQYSSNVALASNITFTTGSNTATVQYTGTSNVAATTLAGLFTIGDQILAGNNIINTQYCQVTNIAVNNSYSGNTLITFSFVNPYRLATTYTSNTVQRYWEFFNVTGYAPGQTRYVTSSGNTAAQDEIHVVVADTGGSFTGTPGSILEVYKGMSRATDALNSDGTSNYYVNILNNSSKYIWWANDRTNALSANAFNIASSTATAPGNYPMTMGNDGYSESAAPLSIVSAAYDLFTSKEDVKISLILQGKPISGTTVSNGITVSNYQLANYIIDNLCLTRKDCVALVSPPKELVLNAFNQEATNLVAWRNALNSTSYAVHDTGYKYMYDRYNDVNRWIPLNGDVAGLCARTDSTNDPWWSPAGFNRGQIKNLIKLAYNPKQADRDLLYSNGVNPVVTFPGSGTLLYGDKTLQAKPSAFDRINVRRLFIVLESAISLAAKYSLFEFNDTFTRLQFKNLVTPYLRTIQGRRGITDFLVVCDDSNNTAQIIDSNQFVGDIYIKPARSINFIQLNFIAVGSGVTFNTVVGSF